MLTESKTEVLQLLKSIRDLAEVEKIISTFIPAFKNKHGIREGQYYLHGNFNLGGTKSGRLSSSNPNLQTIPSTGTVYAKHIKSCFQPPKGWIMIGSDYSSLESRISALQSKDPNMLQVYIEEFDAHSYRALAYYRDQMPDIAEAVAKAELPGKFFKVVRDDGTEEYLHESDLSKN